MTRLLIRQYIRSWGLMTGLLLLFIIGLVSLHIGKVFLERQHDIIEKTAHAQTEHIERNLKYADGGIGLLLYYIRFGLANETPKLAGLSIGQRDIRPPAQLVNIRNLEEQKNTSELVNPFYQLLGNMDFSFVLIYLFPLIIIAISFNLLSEEKEGGTWSLVTTQSSNPLSLIRSKLFIRAGSVLIILIILLVIAKLYLDIPFDQAYLAFTSSSLLYLLFWFALAWFVTSLNKSSSQNALILLSAWILLTTIIPAVLNNAVANLYPIPEAYETTLDSREGYHTKWDQAKEPTIAKFKEHYPQFSQYEHPEGEDFGWFWYFAMQQMGDDEAATSRQEMKEKLHQRNQFTKWCGFLLPSVHTQFYMNALGRSDMTNYLNYMTALEQFHEEKRLNFYPYIFENDPIEKVNWADYKLEYFDDERPINWLLLLPLILISLLFVLLANRIIPKNIFA